MRDRSRMNPEESMFPRDERTLEQRYEDVRAERDDLELRLFDMQTIVTSLLAGELSSLKLSMMRAAKPYLAPARMAPDMDTRRPVVYYVEMSGFVKIGYTSCFQDRMSAFHARREQVLAIEPGGRSLERQRHAEYANDRQGKTELFAHSPEIDAHIASLRDRYPDPWETARELNSPDLAPLKV